MLNWKLKNLKWALPALGFVVASSSYAAFQVPSNPAYNYGNFYIAGGYTLNQANISRHNTDAVDADLRVNRYGTTTILNGEGEAFLHPLTNKNLVVRDQHYKLYRFTEDNNLTHFETKLDNLDGGDEERVGIRVIPVADGFYFDDRDAPRMHTNVGQNGERVEVIGSELLDEFLRKEVYGYTGALAENGPIFSQIVFVHPEGHQGQIKDLPGGTHLKTEMGMTHKGSYVGNGHTRNAPGGYHGNSWFQGQGNYPAILHAIDYKGAGVATDGKFSPALFNLNALIVQMILNQDVEFTANDYKFDTLKTVNLKKSLAYFENWLDSEESRNVLLSRAEHQVYCAEHITMVINIALNVPQNEAGYKAIWGEQRGAELWNNAKKFWDQKVSTNSKMVLAAAATSMPGGFTVGSQKGVFTNNNATQLDAGVSTDYQPMWQLLNVNEPTELTKLGKSLAWKPATVADLASIFVSTYSKWTYVGPANATLAILGFEQEVSTRMNLPKQDFVSHITPIVSKMFQWHAAAIVAAKMSEAGQAINIIDQDNLAAQQPMIAAIINGLKNTGSDESKSYSQELREALTALGLDQKTLGAIIDGNSNREGFLTALDNTLKISALAQRVQRDAVEEEASELIDILELAYDRFKNDTRENMKALNAVEPNDENGSTYVVNEYYNPSLHKVVGDGLYDFTSDERQLVRNYPIAHVMMATQTEPLTATAADPRVNNDYVVRDIHDESYSEIVAGLPLAPRTVPNDDNSTPDDNNTVEPDEEDDDENKRQRRQNRREERRRPGR